MKRIHFLQPEVRSCEEHFFLAVYTNGRVRGEDVKKQLEVIRPSVKIGMRHLRRGEQLRRNSLIPVRQLSHETGSQGWAGHHQRLLRLAGSGSNDSSGLGGEQKVGKDLPGVRQKLRGLTHPHPTSTFLPLIVLAVSSYHPLIQEQPGLMVKFKPGSWSCSSLHCQLLLCE